MKKLLVAVIGLGIVLGTVSFAQDTTDTTKKMSKKKTISTIAVISMRSLCSTRLGMKSKG